MERSNFIWSRGGRVVSPLDGPCGQGWCEWGIGVVKRVVLFEIAEDGSRLFFGLRFSNIYVLSAKLVRDLLFLTKNISFKHNRLVRGRLA